MTIKLPRPKPGHVCKDDNVLFLYPSLAFSAPDSLSLSIIHRNGRRTDSDSLSCCKRQRTVLEETRMLVVEGRGDLVCP
ncbi:hypothetical protein TNCV_4553411 [Trichonephila clavipes]|nr:hypothetical protein TNCV_4553411 [Trichonephila clavipes]